MSKPEEPKQPHAALEIDYQETSDVTNVHAAIQREKKEPLLGSVPIPLWLMSLFGLILCWGSFYLGMFNGGFNSNVFTETAGSGGAKKAGGGGSDAPVVLTPIEMGKKAFLGNCANCHQPTGLGIPGQYPPLAGSEFVNGTPKRLAMIVLKGIQGPIKVHGNTFNGTMPPWGMWPDKQLAAVLTYVRQEWGNTGGEITAAQIAHAREEFKSHTESWSEAELLQVPADAVLEGGAPAPAPGAAPDAKAPPAK